MSLDLQLAMLGLLVGTGISLGGTGWLLVMAFNESRMWGWLCLLCSPAQLAFLVLHIGKTWRPFVLQLLGSLIVFGVRVYIQAAHPEAFGTLLDAPERDDTGWAHEPAPTEQLPVPVEPARDDDPGRLILLSPGVADGEIDGATVTVPVEVALPAGFHEVTFTDPATGAKQRMRVRIGRRATTEICWSFASEDYCTATEKTTASTRW